MRIVCAPDSFKGSLSATEVTKALARGLRATGDVDVVSHPLADGGEGTLEILAQHGFALHHRRITDHLGRPSTGTFGVRGNQAIVESARACGFMPDASAEHSMIASSFGVGELIRNALDFEVEEILLTLGGTATTDGGTGMAQALGIRFLDSNGAEINPGGGGLLALDRVDKSRMDSRITDVAFTALTDVDNPLFGSRGAAVIFGPQKGADRNSVEILDSGLRRLAEVTSSAHSNSPGAGAGGGLGFGAMEFLNADAQSGAQRIMDMTLFDHVLEGADLVITGEGSFDLQSLEGKVPFEVIKRAQQRGIAVTVVCGVNNIEDSDLLKKWGVHRVWSLSEIEPNQTTSIAKASILLATLGEEIGKSLTRK